MSRVVVKDRTPEFLRVAENEIERVIAVAAVKIQKDAKRSLNLGASRGGKNPSAPGTPPHKNTGTLARSIGQETVERRRQFTGRVGSNLEYAMIHEVGGTINHPGGTAYLMVDGEPRFISNDHPKAGTAARTRPHTISMPPRPYLRPALDRVVSRMPKALRKAGQAMTRRLAVGGRFT